MDLKLTKGQSYHRGKGRAPPPRGGGGDDDTLDPLREAKAKSIHREGALPAGAAGALAAAAAVAGGADLRRGGADGSIIFATEAGYG